MKILLKSARITDIQSPHNNTSKDILIEDGFIVNMATSIEDPEAIKVSAPELHVSQGWVDFKAAYYDPGHEERGGLIKGLDDAAMGGFTHVGVLPTNSPVTDNKAGIEYKLRMAENHCVQLHPLGAISKKQEGKELAEMYDMHLCGTRWFSDDQVTTSESVLTRALLYSKDFKGRIIFSARSHQFVNDGQVNEGLASTYTGLKGDPSLDEKLQLFKAIEIAKYTDCPLHVTGISSQSSLALIEEAKKSEVKITTDVHVMNLIFNESSVYEFDTRFKTLPVLRSEEDRLALWTALEKGLIDSIVSDHRPFIKDDKAVAFDEAYAGAPQQVTLFGAMGASRKINTDKLVEILSVRNREVFEIDSHPIQVGSFADLTLYSPALTWQLDSNNSENEYNPFQNKELKGKSLGIVRGNKFIINQEDLVQ